MMVRIPGDFVPLSVHYRRDRAIRRAGPLAELLFVRSIAHIKGQNTGGIVEDFDLADLTDGMSDPQSVVAALVENRLWLEVDDGWEVRSWGKWNPGDASSSGTFGNHQRWHVNRNIVAPDCPHCPTEPSD